MEHKLTHVEENFHLDEAVFHCTCGKSRKITGLDLVTKDVFGLLHEEDSDA